MLYTESQIIFHSTSKKEITVYIFPFKMNEQNLSNYKAMFKDNKELLSFWDNLKTGHDKFFKHLKELNIKVTEKGDYSY